MCDNAPEVLPVGQDVEVEHSNTDDHDPEQTQVNVCVLSQLLAKKFKTQKNK